MSTLIKRRKAEWDLTMKSAISEAAISVFNEYGFHGLRMDRVADAADVAKGTLYNYFNNKDELLLYVMDMKFESIHQEFLNIHSSTVSPPDKLDLIIRTLLTFLEDERGLVIVVIDAEGLSLPVRNSAEAKRETLIKIIAGIIEGGIKNGFFRKFNVIQVAKLVYGAIHASFHIKIRGNDDIRSSEENLSDCMEIFFQDFYQKTRTISGSSMGKTLNLLANAYPVFLFKACP